MAQLKMGSDEQAVLTISIKDRRGRPAPVQNPTLVSSDPTVVTVEFDPANPATATVKGVASETPGPRSALVTFDADADMGEGVKDIMGTLDVVIDDGGATVIEITAGDPTSQTPAAK